jgi:hypothetical protein
LFYFVSFCFILFHFCFILFHLQVADSEQLTGDTKLAFFNQTRHAYGRTALLLSGGATMGLFHLGIVKALHDQKLLPHILSGGFALRFSALWVRLSGLWGSSFSPSLGLCGP